jgi:hypothetical protein
MVIPLQNLIKKDVLYKWGSQENQYFNSIRKYTIESPSLMSLDFSQDFTLYTFSSNRSYAVVFTQKNDESNEIPISFMSSAFKGEELNCPVVYQHAYIVFKEVKHSRPYLLKSKTKIIVPYPVVRNLLLQKELGEKRENWMTSFQEYDLEIVPTQIVRGQGLCKLVSDSFEKLENQINTSIANQHNETQICCTQIVPNSWYDNIRFYLLHRTAPRNLDPKNIRSLRLKYTSFQLIKDILFRKNFDNVFLRCLEKRGI